jgi:hypothetical protein
MVIQGDWHAELAESARASFATSFADSRARFAAAAAAAGAPLLAYRSTALGPDDAELGTDCTWIGNPDAKTVLVLIAGTHGVEGYSGAAVAVDWLRHHAPRWSASDIGVLCIHALNPYGFAWDRRVTHEGCDLNRNFIDFAAPPHNERYAEIAELLLPSSLDPLNLKRAEDELARWREKYGELVFQIARKSGQRTDPNGMFYMGNAPSEARFTLEKIADNYRLAHRDFVIAIDVHTGLGPYGYGEAQNEHPSGSTSFTLAQSTFGPSLTSPELGTSYSVPLHGTMQCFWETLCGDGRHIYLCLEFGTFDQEMSRVAYRNDHWLHSYGDGDVKSAFGQATRAQMRNHFNPDDQSWREMVLMRSRQVVAQALTKLHQI